MSSGSLDRGDIDLYTWKDNLDPAEYVEVKYYLETLIEPELAAAAIAKEQSTVTSQAPGIQTGYDCILHTARIREIRSLGETDDRVLAPYRLNTPTYEAVNYRGRGYWMAQATIAYPVVNFGQSLTNLWNAIGGELHRMGFLNTAKILDISFPERFFDGFTGPLHGLLGIKSRLQIEGRPILCRSTRPAVGLTTEIMLKINESVLRGGFDAVKDDELTCDTPVSPFNDRVKKMANLVRRIEDETGERKCYIANIIDEPAQTLELADAAAKVGADALLVSPPLQGLAIAGQIARRTGLPVFCHNSWGDVMTRHPKFGVSNALYLKMQRLSGGDMVMLPGEFATDYADKDETRSCVTACTEPLGDIRPSLPVIAGGKSPDRLFQYFEAIGSTDFMIIAATAVDNHPEGVEAGARAFREAWSRIASERLRKRSLAM